MNASALFILRTLLQRTASSAGRRGRARVLGTLLFAFLLAYPTTSYAQVARQDSLVLVALYHATGGPNWSNNENWLTGPVASWYGVTLEEGRVVMLWLGGNEMSDGNGLTGSIPVELSRLTHLTWLNLSQNHLTGPIPVELAQLTNLGVLNLDGNQLTGPIPPELGALTNLGSLILSRNQLTGPIPEALGRLTRLEMVHLYENQLSGPIPAAWGPLRMAVFLHDNPGLCKPPGAARWLIADYLSDIADCAGGGREIRQNPRQDPGMRTDSLALVALYNATGGSNWTDAENWLTGPVASWFGVTVEAGRVTALLLIDNQVAGAFPAELGGLTALRDLRLEQNQLSGPLPAALSQLSSLEYVSLYENHLSGPIPPALSRLTRLATLDLRDNQFTGPIPPELGALTQLEVLVLNGNQLTGPIPVEIGRLTNLQYLYLSQNQLTGAIPSELAQLSNLTDLRLDAGTGLCKPPGAAAWRHASLFNDLGFCEAETPVPPRTGRTPSRGTPTEVENPPATATLTPEEHKLVDLINTYRASRGLPAIPVSASLTYTAKTHLLDVATNKPDQGMCNGHSWSASTRWKGCCYTNDHREASCMWEKPRELTEYTGDGFEIFYGSSDPKYDRYTASAEDALASWKSSPGHHSVIINEGIWADKPWKAMGVGIHEGLACVWFGEVPDSGRGGGHDD